MGDAAAAPPAAPVTQAVMSEPSATNSSKRKWSPCTWRYAIEEVQPELGSKPRRENYVVSASSVHRERDRERASSFPEPSKLSSSPDKPVLHPGVNPISMAQSSNRQSGEKMGMDRKQGVQQQRHGDERDDAAKNRIQRRGVQGDGEEDSEERRRRRRREEKEAMKREMAGREGHSGGRTEREMTPSELYFCDICSGRARDGEGSASGCR